MTSILAASKLKTMNFALIALVLTGSLFAQTPTPRPATLNERLKPLATVPAERKFPTLLDPVTDVVMTLTGSNAESIRGVARVLAKNAPTVKLWVFFPESFDPLNPKQKPRVAKTLADLQKDLKKEAAGVHVEYQTHPYLQYPNPQDLGQFFWYLEQKTWRTGFVDFHRGGRELKTEIWPLENAKIFKAELPLEEPLLLVDRLKTNFGAEILRLPVPARDFGDAIAANHGGNAVLLPGKILVVGASLAEAPRAMLAQWTGAHALTVATRFLQQPLLSQAYAFVPATGPCGYALVVASPLEGLQVRQKESFKKGDLDERILETVFYFAKNPNLNADGVWKVEDFELTRAPRTYRERETGDDFVGQPRFFDFVVQKTLQAEAEIQTSARELRAALKARKLCADLPVLRVPVIAFVADENEYFDGENGVGADGRAQMLSPTTNLVSVGPDVLMGDFQNSPEPYRKELRERTQKALETGGVPRERQHFLPSEFYNESLGSLGGGLLLLRRPAEIPTEAPARSQ